MKYLLITIVTVTITGCVTHHCESDSIDKRAEFILSCVRSGKSESDDSEGLVRQCSMVSVMLYCEAMNGGEFRAYH